MYERTKAVEVNQRCRERYVIGQACIVVTWLRQRVETTVLHRGGNIPHTATSPIRASRGCTISAKRFLPPFRLSDSEALATLALAVLGRVDK